MREPPFPIVRHPATGARIPILVSVPHYGTQSLPHITRDDYSEPWFETFAYGFADTFARDLYHDLHEHGATLLATPFSRMFVDVNRRRDDFEHHAGEVRSRRGVVRTHTMREVPIFARPLARRTWRSACGRSMIPTTPRAKGSSTSCAPPTATRSCWTRTPAARAA